MAVVPLAGCSSMISSSFHNVPVSREYGLRAVRFDTPGNFPAAIRICDHHEGIYTAESTGGSVFVVPDDPNCPANR